SAAETVRKMVVAMARDIRVLVIKLADRLHNMRTIEFMPPDKQEKKSHETLEIYAPLAHRLGMNTMKWELEDLAFATLYPKIYEEIERLVGQRAPARDHYLTQVIDDIEADVRAARIKASVTGRPKHLYSVYQKMVVRGRDFADIYDLVGVRILVESVRDCYAVLGIVHSRWSPVPGRFKDFIAMPKFNMYQSLHTTVIGPEGKPVELQIRTWDMHRAAEFGVAAHWRYKQRDVGGKQGPDDLGWLRQLLEWQRETEDPEEFMDSLRYDLSSSEVFVFTPKGDVVALPGGSTPVDFAYSVHTEVGHRCVGARVNGKLVPLESALDNGDVVEVFTSKAEGAGPSRDWLNFVKSARARSKIKAWFSKERREEAIEHGKDAIVRAMRKEGLPLQRLMTNQALATIAAELHQPDVSALYAAVGEGRISAPSIIKRLVAAAGGVEAAADESAEAFTPSTPKRSRVTGDAGVMVRGADDVWVKLARCTDTPLPRVTKPTMSSPGTGVQ
ncbi:MAG: RelA/SpoT family protein, partial [Actinomycetota bacterium]